MLKQILASLYHWEDFDDWIPGLMEPVLWNF